jgi:hypothetical protein
VWLPSLIYFFGCNSVLGFCKLFNKIGGNWTSDEHRKDEKKNKREEISIKREGHKIL